jgi:hypothetical protein
MTTELLLSIAVVVASVVSTVVIIKDWRERNREAEVSRESSRTYRPTDNGEFRN